MHNPPTTSADLLILSPHLGSKTIESGSASASATAEDLLKQMWSLSTSSSSSSSSPPDVKGEDQDKKLGAVEGLTVADVKLAKKYDDKVRKEIVFEIVESEIKYVEYLNTMNDLFLVPLRNSIKNDLKIVTENDVKVLFFSLESLIGFNGKLCNDLRRRLAEWSATTQIGDIFISIAPFLKYTHTLSLFSLFFILSLHAYFCLIFFTEYIRRTSTITRMQQGS